MDNLAGNKTIDTLPDQNSQTQFTTDTNNYGTEPEAGFQDKELNIKKRKKIFSIILLIVFIVSMLANGVLGYYLNRKVKAYKSQQSIIDNKINCPALAEAPVLTPAEETPVAETPASVTTTPTTTKKKTTTTTTPTPAPVQEEVLLPPPPPPE